MRCLPVRGIMPRIPSVEKQWREPQRDTATMTFIRQLKRSRFVEMVRFEERLKNHWKYKINHMFLFLQHHNILVLKNSIDVTHFQSNSPNSIPLSEEFWKALTRLPSVYDYAAYRKVIERFGTHYVSEGSLGGSFKVVASIDEETKKETSKDWGIISYTLK